ncbi:pentapeptide repeat-containing protein [Microseira sp. BLCC-F43]|jgi:uncharacterized protein YjbI with pentapeptide repeats|uniref:pentapeptide repeat-containing protein n=1 Tax=Microseira sp. BLCC-F43 TaxID=3153602 RepID=UPI0035B95BF2
MQINLAKIKIVDFPKPGVKNILSIDWNGWLKRQQQTIILFDSVNAASDVAFMLNGEWDGSNGVVMQKCDEIAVDAAANLVGASWCYQSACEAVLLQLNVDQLRRRYAIGDRYFINANLRCTNLSQLCLSDINLSWAKLNLANLCGTNLSKANLTAADITAANLSGCNLNQAQLVRANLASTNLSRADLTGANLSRACLIDADLRDADLRGANLSQAELRGANLNGALV